MDDDTQFNPVPITANPLSPNSSLNDTQYIVFIIYCIFAVFVIFFIIFYLNRVFAWGISKVVSWYTWRNYHFHVEVESFSFSFLSGKLFFKNFRYFSNNTGASVVQGYLTFRYWLLATQNDAKEKEEQEDPENKKLPCRVACYVKGLELFIFNKKEVYEQLSKSIFKSELLSESNDENTDGNQTDNGLLVEDVGSGDRDSTFFSNLLPIDIEICQGALTIGNKALPTVATWTFDKACGIYKDSKPRSRYDIKKTCLDLVLSNSVIKFKRNPDFSYNNESQDFKRMSRYLNGHEVSKMEEWLKKNLNSSKQPEYAKVTTILESKHVELNYYVDVAGKVPESVPSLVPQNEIDIGNKDLSPQWGIDLKLQDSSINYGPWADKQRFDIQRFFFPMYYEKFQPTPILKPGQLRVHTSFNVFANFTGETTWRFPIREKSKDWRYIHEELSKKTTKGKPRVSRRPFGWIDVIFQGQSILQVNVPMVLGLKGSSIKYDIVLNSAKLTTSVNYATLLSSNGFQVSGSIDYPLEWNGRQEYVYNIKADISEVSLLRDHITLIQDLVADWGNDQRIPVIYFIPCTYQLNFLFTQTEWLFCVNDRNVINIANDRQENAFFILRSPYLKTTTTISFLQHEPTFQAVSYIIELNEVEAELSLPESGTIKTFLPEGPFMTCKFIFCEGEYVYANEVDPENVDVAAMSLSLSGIEGILYGFLLRYALIFIDNFFGLYVNFMTLEEYTGYIKENTLKSRILKPIIPSNKFELLLTLDANNLSISLPTGIYNNSKNIFLRCNELKVDNRNADSFQDLQIQIGPLLVSKEEIQHCAKKLKTTNIQHDRDFLFFDRLLIHANRWFGPPPLGIAYYNHWIIDLGHLVLEVEPRFMELVVLALEIFYFHYIDRDNAFNINESSLSNGLDVLDICIVFEEIEAIFFFSPKDVAKLWLCHGMKFYYHDYASTLGSAHGHIDIPQVLLHFLCESENYSTWSKQGMNNSQEWVEVGFFNGGIDMEFHLKPATHEEKFRKQEEFLKCQDETFKRLEAIKDRYLGNTIREDVNATLSLSNSMMDLEMIGVDSRIVGAGNYRESDAEHSESEESFKSFTTATDTSIIEEEGLPPCAYLNYLNKFHCYIRPHFTKYLFNMYSKPSSTLFISKSISSSQSQYGIDGAKKMVRNSKSIDEIESSDIIESNLNFICGCKYPISIIITPEICKFIKLYMDSHHSETLTIDNVMDSIQLDYMAKLIKGTELLFERINFDLELKSFTINIIQESLNIEAWSYLNPEENIPLKDIRLHDSLTSVYTIAGRNKFTSIQWRKSIHYNQCESGKNPFNDNLIDFGLKCTINELDFALNAAVNFAPGVRVHGIQERLGRSIHSSKFQPKDPNLIMTSVLELTTKRMELFYVSQLSTNDFITMNVGIRKSMAYFVPNAMEILGNTLLTWKNKLIDMKESVDKKQSKEEYRKKALISQIALEEFKSKHTGGTDPVFLIRPSNLWRIGAEDFQNNDGWKLFFHLRFCVMTFPQPLKDQITRFISEGGHEKDKTAELFSQTISSLASWRNWEVGDLSLCSLLLYVFYSSTVDNEGHQYIPITQQVTIASLEVCICENEKNVNRVFFEEMCLIIEESFRIPGDIMYQSQPNSNVKIVEGSPREILKKKNEFSQCQDLIFNLSSKRCEFNLSPFTITIAAHAIRYFMYFMDQVKDSSSSNIVNTKGVEEKPESLLHIFIDLGILDISFIAPKLIFELSVAGTRSSCLFNEGLIPIENPNHPKGSPSYTSSHISQKIENPNLHLTNSAFLTVESFDFQVLQRHYGRKKSIQKLQLFVFSFKNIGIEYVTYRQFFENPKEGHSKYTELILLNTLIGQFKIEAPQNIIKLNTFFEEWGTDDLPMYRNLIKQLNQELARKKRPSSTSMPSADNTNIGGKLACEVLIGDIQLHSEMLPSLTLTFTAKESYCLIRTSLDITLSNHIDYMLKLTGQTVGFSRKVENESATMALPDFKAIGIFYSSKILERNSYQISATKTPDLKSVISLGNINGSLSADWIESILQLAMEVKNEATEIVDLFLLANRKRKASNSLIQTQPNVSEVVNPGEKFKFNVRVVINGLRIIALSPSANIVFESGTINGYTRNIEGDDASESPLKWRVAVEGMSLSVNHGTYDSSLPSHNVKRKNLAFVLVSLALHNYDISTPLEALSFDTGGGGIPMSTTPDEAYFLTLSKVHSVMQPAAVKKIAEFWLYYSKHISSEKVMTSIEMDKIAEETKRVLNYFEVDLTQDADAKRFLQNKKVAVEAKSLSVAIVIDEENVAVKDGDFEESKLYWTTTGGKKGNSKKALLVSTNHLSGASLNFERSKALVKGFCIQFVADFNQSLESHFNQSTHPKINQFLLPQFCIEVLWSHRLQVNADVTGFVMDIEPSVVSYIMLLDEAWKRSRAGAEVFLPSTATAMDSSSNLTKQNVSTKSSLQPQSKGTILEVEAVFMFGSSSCRFLPRNYSSDKSLESKMGLTHSPTSHLPRLNLDYMGSSQGKEPLRPSGLDVVILPGVSLIFNFTTTLEDYSLISSDSKNVNVSVIIEPSQNVVYPSLKVFIGDILEELTICFKKQNSESIPSLSDNALSFANVPAYDISFTIHLLLSRTLIELSCQPMSKVSCSLNVEEIALTFISSVDDDNSKSLSCSGVIQQTSGRIRHAFSPEDCVQLLLEEITFNTTLKTKGGMSTQDMISAMVRVHDFSGGVNVRHLQDLFLFAKAWVGSIQLWSESTKSDPISSQPFEVAQTKGTSFFLTMIDIAVPTSKLFIDLGSSVGRVNLEIGNCMGRFVSQPGTFRRFYAAIESIKIISEGKLSGYLKWKDVCMIANSSMLRRNYKITYYAHSRKLKSILEYQYERIVVLHIQPCYCLLREVKDEQSEANMDVFLSSFKGMLAAKTYPSFILMRDKLVSLLEEKIHSAQIKFITSPDGQKGNAETTPLDQQVKDLSKQLKGKVKIVVPQVELTLFPRHFTSQEFVQMNLKGLNIELIHLGLVFEKQHREVSVSYGDITIEKSTVAKISQSEERKFTSKEWFQHVSARSNKKILSLPATIVVLRMHEKPKDVKKVYFEFTSTFSGGIDIALNFGLYKYLLKVIELYQQLPSGPLPDLERELTKSEAPTTTTSVVMTSPSNVPAPPDTLIHEGVEFIALKPVQFNPTMKILGEATPSVEWLGLQTQKIPVLLYTEVASKLEHLFSLAYKLLPPDSE